MKKIIDLIKKAFGLAKTVTPEQKQEIQEIATQVVAALDEVKAKKEKAAPAEGAAPKKKKKYYPAQPKKAK